MMKNSIKFLFLSLFTPLFIGVSFGASFFDNTQFTTVYSSRCDSSTQNTSNCFIDAYYYKSSSENHLLEFNNNGVYCFVMSSNLSGDILNDFSDYLSRVLVFRYMYYSYRNSFTYDTVRAYLGDFINGNYVFHCSSNYFYNNNGNSVFQLASTTASTLTSVLSDIYSRGVYFDYEVGYVPFTGFNNLPNNGDGSSDCSSVEGQLNTCLDRVNTLNGQVGTLSGSLQTCNSDLASCTNSCDTLVSQCVDEKNNLQTSLSGCVDDKNSLQNYNNSLSDQLNECLSNGTGGTGLTFVPQFDLFRSSDGTDYSFPISNNLFLPYGYKGYINEGVLSIKQDNSLNTAYSISDDDFEHKIIGSFSTIFLFLISSGLFLVFLFVIRRYFIGLKSFK